MKKPPKIQQVESFVVTKRRHHPHHLFKNAPKSPSYFVTFEIQDGSQLELEVPYEYFTFFIEGDEGVLYYQDRAFLSFERTKRL
ncbi:DUF2500 domain-containing protein [Turicibacter sanguinis]|uniref:DUF2500 domain-containing protein n=1 Tax=Turicibacter sanguinis TaxID=154288 RepID=UPI0021D4C494|nr:DUF2500 domain-containing protein [Turicibacter sanguinis]MCU7195600.1 DUF2500 domain-containing protein [Turicibacter sanguinis]